MFRIILLILLIPLLAIADEIKIYDEMEKQSEFIYANFDFGKFAALLF